MPRFVSVDELVDVHALGIEEFGGDLGLRDPDGPAAIAAQAKTAWSYTGDLFEVAAAYILYTNQRHCWVDGNKRVSATCCVLFLSWNGVATGHSTDDLRALILGVAANTKSWSREEVASRLRDTFG